MIVFTLLRLQKYYVLDINKTEEKDIYKEKVNFSPMSLKSNHSR